MTELERSAVLICKALGMLSGGRKDFGELSIVRAAIENETEWSSCDLEEAAKRIYSAATIAQQGGECINRFWFIDRRWRHPKGNGNGQQKQSSYSSRARQRAESNARSLYEALRDHLGKRIVCDGD